MCSNSSMLHLPPHLLTDILSRLPIKSILFCRCVCKIWFELISSEYFTNHLYPSTAPLTLLLQPINPCISDAQLLFDLTSHDQDLLLTFKPGTNLPNLQFRLVGSCNGLLSLYEPKTNDPIYVCNPVSGEFITLPKYEGGKYSRVVAHGFGFSPAIKNYKVIRIVEVSFRLGVRLGSRVLSRTAEIYTLGEGTWRSLGDVCKFSHVTTSNAFLNGTLHWDTHYDEPYISFNLDTERFGSILGPELDRTMTTKMVKRSLGVVRGCLSVCDFEDPALVEIWVMKDYGVRESWNKDLVLVNSICESNAGLFSCDVLMILESGEVLMVLDHSSLLLHDPKRQCFRLLTPLSSDAPFEVIVHVPTIASLKDVAPGENVQHVSQTEVSRITMTT